MGERLSEPTATKMATISSDKAAAATEGKSTLPTSRPSELPRTSTADVICNWSGENTPDRSRDLYISARQPPNRCNSASSSWSKPSGNTNSPTNECTGPGPNAPSNGGDLETPEELRTLGHPPRPPKNDRRLRVTLPPPEQEGDGHAPHGIVTPSPGSRSQSKFTQWGPLPTTACIPGNEDGEPSMISSVSSLRSPIQPKGREGIQKEDRKGRHFNKTARQVGNESTAFARQLHLSMESILKEETYDNTHSWRQTAEVTICICSRRKKIQQPSKAIEQIDLLRRGFFPRRDVIKWNFKPPSQRWR
jgi:hypothetical protein